MATAFSVISTIPAHLLRRLDGSYVQQRRRDAGNRLARISHHPLGGWIIGCELECFFLSVAFAVDARAGGWLELTRERGFLADLARLRTHVCLDSLRVHFAICLRRRALPPAPRAGSARRGRTHSCTDNPSQGPRAPAARSPEPAPRSSAAASAPFHTLPLQTPSPEGLARISHHPLGGWIIGCELECFFLSVAFAVEPGPVGGWS